MLLHKPIWSITTIMLVLSAMPLAAIGISPYFARTTFIRICAALIIAVFKEAGMPIAPRCRGI